jgi:putative FmdB family regulatory protein
LDILEAVASRPEEVAMPVYEFHCHKCGKPFEVVRNVSDYDPAKVRCPDCKSRKVERRWSSVSTITSKKS